MVFDENVNLHPRSFNKGNPFLVQQDVFVFRRRMRHYYWLLFPYAPRISDRPPKPNDSHRQQPSI